MQVHKDKNIPRRKKARKYDPIDEEYHGYLAGGPFNRFALALKSHLDNEIDWACTRLVEATKNAPENWSLIHHAPFLVEAILAVLEQSRTRLDRDIVWSVDTKKNSLKHTLLSGTSDSTRQEQAERRAEALAIVLYNIAQVGENAAIMAQDPRMTIEITRWLGSAGNSRNGTRIQTTTTFLDLIDVVLPYVPPPRFEIEVPRTWPRAESWGKSSLDPLVFVETCLWRELVGLLVSSKERTHVLGATRALIQLIAWHPQMARDIFDLPVPSTANTTSSSSSNSNSNNNNSNNINTNSSSCANDDNWRNNNNNNNNTNNNNNNNNNRTYDANREDVRATVSNTASNVEPLNAGSSQDQKVPTVDVDEDSVGQVIAERAAQLLLVPDLDIASGAMELLLNISKLETLAHALDEELEHAALSSPGCKRQILRRRNRRLGLTVDDEQTESHSGADSGVQTPVFGFKPRGSALSSLLGGPQHDSRPSTLPSGLVGLVGLISNQWLSAACPPSNELSKEDAGRAQQALDNQKDAEEERYKQHNHNHHQNHQQKQTLQGKDGMSLTPPTEPELREACTWVLLNYEFTGTHNNIMQLVDLFRRYMIAKNGQTVPRIGRALSFSEMMRVVAAVFPRVVIQNTSAGPGMRTGSDAIVGIGLRPKTQQIVPIPAVAVDNSQPKQKVAQEKAKEHKSNACMWAGCEHQFESETQACDHITAHLGESGNICRWGGCNRIPQPGNMDPKLQMIRHCLTHGPFYTEKDSTSNDNGEASSSSNETTRPDTVPGVSDAGTSFQDNAKVQQVKASILGLISPPVDSLAESKARVFTLVLQGIGLLEQLQKWTDRRKGPLGARDCERVWRGSEVVERLAYIAAQPTPVAVYASRLLAVLGTENAHF